LRVLVDCQGEPERVEVHDLRFLRGSTESRQQSGRCAPCFGRHIEGRSSRRGYVIVPITFQ